MAENYELAQNDSSLCPMNLIRKTSFCSEDVYPTENIFRYPEESTPSPTQKRSPFFKSIYKNRLLHVSLEATLGNLFSNLYSKQVLQV